MLKIFNNDSSWMSMIIDRQNHGYIVMSKYTLLIIIIIIMLFIIIIYCDYYRNLYNYYHNREVDTK